MEGALSDIPWADEDEPLAVTLRLGLRRSMGLGLLAGSGEFVSVCATTALDLGFDEALLLGGASLVTAVVLSAIFTVFLVWPVRRLGASTLARMHARLLGAVGGALVAWHLWPAGFALLNAPGRLPSALAFFAMPLGVVGVVSLNARYWIRRRANQADEGLPSGPGWTPLALGVAVLIILVSSFTLSGRQYGGQAALQTDPPVLLVTVDALRADHVSLSGDSDLRTGAIDELAEGGTFFPNAVTPSPMTVPAHAAMLTGIHPVRTGVLSDQHSLSSRYGTLAERLAEEGYATAAFVSDAALGRGSGLGQGFAVYDDDMGSWVRGLQELSLAEAALDIWSQRADARALEGLQERAGDVTLGRAMAWLRDHGNDPFFLWVHLAEPDWPYRSHGATGQGRGQDDHRGRYAEEVLHADQLVGDFMDAVRDRIDRPMVVVFASAFGQNLGEDGLGHSSAGLFDQVVRVPLIVKSHSAAPLHSRVEAQVRLMDVPNTVMALLGIDQDDDIESGDLTAFMEGTQSRDYATFLLGQTSASIARGSVFGYRAAKSGAQPGEMLKFIWNPGLDKHWLFDLSSDPLEAADMSLSQASVVSQMQAQVRKELASAATEGAEAEGLRARLVWARQR
jgi:arylsulfatase A-like enzyme